MIIIRTGAIGFTVAAIVGTAAVALQPPLPSAPGQWVPFTAQFQRIDRSTGDVITQGRILVDAAGSERRESRRAGGGSYEVVEIRNQAARRFCRWRVVPDATINGTWTCQPMDVMPRPMSVARGEPGPAVESFRTVVVDNSRGSRWTFAPDLSWFPVLQEDSAVTLRLFDIQLGAPDDSVFHPPPGVTVRELAEKGGRVLQRRH